MTAGRGVLHCEMPGPEGGEGLQLWVNLAAKNKMVDAGYQELLKKDIPVVKRDGVTAVVIAGECLGVQVKTCGHLDSPGNGRTVFYFFCSAFFPTLF